MQKVSMTVVTKKGKKKISVWLDEETIKALSQCRDKILAKRYIILEHKDNLINRKETRRHQSLDKSMDNGFDFADERVDIFEDVARKISYENLHIAISKLLPQQQWLINEIFFKGRTQISIAEELGIGESAIRSRLKKIYEKLKNFYN